MAKYSTSETIMDTRPQGSTDVWAAIVWWLEFPELSKLWATGNRWLHYTMTTAPNLKIAGYCDPLLFNFTKLAALDLSADGNLDITSLPQPLSSSIRSLIVHLSATPVRQIVTSDFPPQLTSLTLHITEMFDIQLLPKSLTSLTILCQPLATPNFRCTFLTELITELPNLQSLILPQLSSSMSLDWPEALPTRLTRLEALCSPELEDLLTIPPAVTELNIAWEMEHLTFIPQSLTCLTLRKRDVMTPDHVNRLPAGVIKLDVAYRGPDLSCFERLPLRKLIIDLYSYIDFRCTLPYLTYLGVVGAKGIYVPSSVQVLRLGPHYDSLLFTRELRLRKFLGRAITDSSVVAEQFKQCTSSQTYATVFTSITMVATHLQTFNTVCLRILVISISDSVKLPEVLDLSSSFTNLIKLEVTQSVFGSTSKGTQTHSGNLKVPPMLSSFYLEGRYHLPDLILPPSITRLQFRGLKIPSSVLIPLRNLRWLSITFPKFEQWAPKVVMQILTLLPKRMVYINLETIFASYDLSSYTDHIATRSRYLQHIAVC